MKLTFVMTLLLMASSIWAQSTSVNPDFIKIEVIGDKILITDTSPNSLEYEIEAGKDASKIAYGLQTIMDTRSRHREQINLTLPALSRIAPEIKTGNMNRAENVARKELKPHVVIERRNPYIDRLQTLLNKTANEELRLKSRVNQLENQKHNLILTNEFNINLADQEINELNKSISSKDLVVNRCQKENSQLLTRISSLESTGYSPELFNGRQIKSIERKLKRNRKNASNI